MCGFVADEVAAPHGSVTVDSVAPDVDVAPRRKRVRYNSKSSACQKCHGPCGPDCCAELDVSSTQEEGGGPTAAANSLESSGDAAADAFARAVEARERAKPDCDGAAVGHAAPSASQPATGKRRRVTRASAPLNFGQVPGWLAADPVIGGARVHASHRIGWHRGLIWCWECGVYATAVPICLKTACDGATLAGQKNLARFRQGLPPSKADWPLQL